MMTLMHVQFGSHLYGTATPASDTDYKAVVVPSARDILLQRVQGTVSNARTKAAGEKNGVSDVDDEAYALHRYLNLLAEGQTVALDILFAPRWAMTHDPHPLWTRIVENRHRLLSRRASSFIGYCRTQANKYGIKGSRVHAVREIVGWFDQAIAVHGPLAKLGDAAADLPAFIADRALQHTEIVPILQASRPEPIPHLQCCQRKAPFTISLKDTRAIFARVLEEYGQRALQAERNENVDWKALSHAVRVGHEALELMATGWITFPLPNAKHILAIKRGELPYAVISEEIESLLDRVEAAQAVSVLPDKADAGFIDALVIEAYGAAVRSDAHPAAWAELADEPASVRAGAQTGETP